MREPEVLLEGVVFGETPRWHDGRLWFSDWGAGQVIALDPGGGHEVVTTVRSFPLCIDFLPDGRLLVMDSARRRLLRREPDGSLVSHASLSGISDKPWGDIVTDERGSAYVDSIGFDFPRCVRVREGGAVLEVAGWDRGAFACALSRGADPRLFVVGQTFGGPPSPRPTGQVVAFPAPAPGAGRP